MANIRRVREATTIGVDLGDVTGTRPVRWIEALVFFVPLFIYMWLPASVINGDGLHYYNIASRDDWASKFLPGHLLYGPFVAFLGHVANTMYPVRLDTVMLLANQVAGAFTVFLMFQTAKRLGIHTSGQWIAALGLAFSFGFWIQASDVETYALAAFFVVAGLYQMARYVESGARQHLVLLGAVNSLAALFHLSAVSLLASSLCLIVLVGWRDPARLGGSLAAYLGSVLLFFGLPLLMIAGWVQGLENPREVLTWIRAASHGHSAVVNVLSVPRAVYGLARTFLFLEFFYDAPRWVIAIKGLGLLAGALWTIYLIVPIRNRLTPAATIVLGSMSIFALSQVAFGATWFPSDTERWIFIAPMIWLLLGAYLSLVTASQKRVAVVALGLVFTINLIQGIWPLSTNSLPKERVWALHKVLPAESVVVTPGYDWVGYYRYLTSTDVDNVLLIDLAAKHRNDQAAFFDHLQGKIAGARAGGRSVIMIRILDPAENIKATPWPELKALGYSRDLLRQWLDRYDWEEQRLADPAHTRVYWLR